MLFAAVQRYIAAIACLKRALYLDPFEWLVAYNLGLLHLSTGQAASAFHYFSTAINLKPEFAHRWGVSTVGPQRKQAVYVRVCCVCS
jgi:Bardet-Biedl syndrome 4 protein